MRFIPALSIPSAERLLRLGAPAKIANSSEWDAIDPKFTALRGFGNVIWFPVSTAPVLLGQGAEMFDSVGKWKLSESNAEVSMHVLVEYLDVKPTVAFLERYSRAARWRVFAKAGCTRPLRRSRSGNAPAPGEKSTSSGSASETSAVGILLHLTTTAGNTILQVASFTFAADAVGIRAL